MRILIVSARYKPETFTIGPIAEKLVEKGHEVTVLTGRPHYGRFRLYDGYETLQDEVINGVKVLRVNEKVRTPGTKALIMNYLSIYREYPKRLKKIPCDYDIVLSHVMSPIFTMRGIKKYCKKNNIPHMHYGFDLWPESLIATGYLKRKSLAFKMLKSYSKKMYKTCDLITYASPSTETYFKDYLKVDVPFKHIYQPCLTEQPELSLVDTHEFAKEGKKRILFCGTIAKFSHLEFIINAFKNEEIRNNFIFDIVGSGSEMENAQKLVNELQLQNSVIFHGRVQSSETIRFYLNSDILFVPLYRNSKTSDMIPQKVIEYFMYGKPILGMLGGDGKALINEASNMNVICDQTVESLEDGLKQLNKYSSKDMMECGLSNYNYYKKSTRFSLDAVCDELIECMDSLICK